MTSCGGVNQAPCKGPSIPADGYCLLGLHMSDDRTKCVTVDQWGHKEPPQALWRVHGYWNFGCYDSPESSTVYSTCGPNGPEELDKDKLWDGDVCKHNAGCDCVGVKDNVLSNPTIVNALDCERNDYDGFVYCTTKCK